MSFTNWYLENHETPPIGLAVNLLEGTHTMFVSAMAEGIDKAQFLKLVVYRTKIIDLYIRSKRKAEASNMSFQTKRDILTGNSILNEMNQAFKKEKTVIK